MLSNKILSKVFAAAALAACAGMFVLPQVARAQDPITPASLVLVNPLDLQAINNVTNTLRLYEMMINEGQPVYATAKYCAPNYIQHNPLIPTGSAALGQFFAAVEAAHPNAHVVVHEVTAVGNYVFAHVNFFNLTTSDPNDTGVAGTDIYRFDSNGLVAEHWDTLQVVGTPQNAAPWYGPNIPAANNNGMF
ncbi:nuclear transport factor 2 family protein [Paraburkholderia acidicola]|uniref:Nuclear transport factor 2 family protein n=1 Tax=Paraburkholderia acidicola TaxID=1912599 RepID=A0ABV1LLX1_9BURK